MMGVCILLWLQCRHLGVLENPCHWVYLAACTPVEWLITWTCSPEFSTSIGHKHGLVQLLGVTVQNCINSSMVRASNTVLLIAAAVPVMDPAALCSDQGSPGGSCCFSLSLSPHSSHPPQLSFSRPWSWTSARDLSVENIILSCWLRWLCKSNRLGEEFFDRWIPHIWQLTQVMSRN